MTNDAHHMTAPRPDGSQAARSMRLALDDADVAAGRDRLRQRARQLDAAQRSRPRRWRSSDVFGDHAYRIPVSSTKGYYGHALGASGAIEAAICALALEQRWLPPTVNLDDAGRRRCDLDYMPGHGTRRARRARAEQLASASAGSTPRSCYAERRV